VHEVLLNLEKCFFADLHTGKFEYLFSEDCMLYSSLEVICSILATHQLDCKRACMLVLLRLLFHFHAAYDLSVLTLTGKLEIEYTLEILSLQIQVVW
jgi:hypothetical protein